MYMPWVDSMIACTVKVQMMSCTFTLQLIALSAWIFGPKHSRYCRSSMRKSLPCWCAFRNCCFKNCNTNCCSKNCSTYYVPVTSLSAMHIQWNSYHLVMTHCILVSTSEISAYTNNNNQKNHQKYEHRHSDNNTSNIPFVCFHSIFGCFTEVSWLLSGLGLWIQYRQ